MGFQNLTDSFAFANAHFNLMKDRQGAEKAHVIRYVMLCVQQANLYDIFLPSVFSVTE